MPDQRFTKAHRIRRRIEFARVYQGEVYAADRTLVIHLADNGLDVARLGLSVSRKVGNAVVRNYWKRIIREAFRRCRERIPTGIDIVARPKRGAEPCFPAVERSLPALIARAIRKLPGPSDSLDERDEG